MAQQLSLQPNDFSDGSKTKGDGGDNEEPVEETALAKLRRSAKGRDDFGSGAETGIYFDVPEEKYFDHPGLSRSVLAKAARHATDHAIEKWRNDEEDSSKEMDLGSALHFATLQPKRYEERFDVAPEECEATTGSGDPCTYSAKERYDGKWRCGVHAPEGEEADEIEVLKGEHAKKVTAMTEALKKDQDARPLLWDMEGIEEVTILFDDPVTGLRCKARLDRVVQVPSGGLTVVDLKSTDSAHPADFRRSMARYGYWLQPPFYELALLEGTDPNVSVRDFVFPCVETDSPFVVQCYRLDSQALEGAKTRLNSLLDEFSEAVSEGPRGGYRDGVASIGLRSYEKERLGIPY